MAVYRVLYLFVIFRRLLELHGFIHSPPVVRKFGLINETIRPYHSVLGQGLGISFTHLVTYFATYGDDLIVPSRQPA
jgi:hypothetical protein